MNVATVQITAISVYLCLFLSPRYWINLFSCHPQLPRPNARRTGYFMGAHVCHRYVVSKEISTQDLQEGSVC